MALSTFLGVNLVTPKGVRAFRIRPGLVKAEKWLEPASSDAITAQPLEITLRLGAM